MKDVIIVGCGIIGATVKKAMLEQGRKVAIYDSGEEMAGTKPSGGHLKPGWLSGMKKEDYEPAIELLEHLWDMDCSDFKVRPTGLKTKVYRVDTDVVIKTPRIKKRIVKVDTDEQYPVVVTEDGEHKCRLLVVSAGVWCRELFPDLFPTKKELQPKQGISFRFKGTCEPFIKPWAPYKQVVAHQQSENEIWVGDGSVIIPNNWDDKRTRQCLGRCRSALGFGKQKPCRQIMGLRPYCQNKGEPCYYHKVGRNAYVVTGAAKLGTVAAGWAARRLLDETS